MIREDDLGGCPLHFPCISLLMACPVWSHIIAIARGSKTVIIHLSIIKDELRNLANGNGLSLCAYHVSYLISEY
jgi:hypothetical protein